MCKICGDDRCSGKYLLHTKEMKDLFNIIEKELRENSKRKFLLIDSPGSGEIFTKFYELHVIDNVSDEDEGKLIDKRGLRILELDARALEHIAKAMKNRAFAENCGLIE